jgi:nucleotide-binding universal stress UspA family protein
MIPASDAGGPATGIRPSCPYRQVLVGWDGSADAVAALAAAAGIAAGTAGRVVALAVLPASASMEQPATNTDGAAVQHSFEHARQALRLPSDARMSLHIARGQHAAQLICQYAADHGFDLIVLGRQGQGGLMPHRLGRVADTAARASRIPVLLLSSS